MFGQKTQNWAFSGATAGIQHGQTARTSVGLITKEASILGLDLLL